MRPSPSAASSTYGTLSPGPERQAPAGPGPVGIERSTARPAKEQAGRARDGERCSRSARSARSSSPSVADQVGSILQNVVKPGTATRAFVPGVMIAGKTGTTEGYGDAWFVGWTKEYTVAIWVGYPDKFKPMETEFQGDPVAGGTYPAGIFKTFMESLLKNGPVPKKDGGDGRAGHDRRRARGAAPAAPRPPRRAADATTAPPPDGGGATGGARAAAGALPQARRPPHAATRPPAAAGQNHTADQPRRHRAPGTGAARRGYAAPHGGGDRRTGRRRASRARRAWAARAARRRASHGAEAPRAARPPW